MGTATRPAIWEHRGEAHTSPHLQGKEGAQDSAPLAHLCPGPPKADSAPMPEVAGPQLGSDRETQVPGSRAITEGHGFSRPLSSLCCVRTRSGERPVAQSGSKGPRGTVPDPTQPWRMGKINHGCQRQCLAPATGGTQRPQVARARTGGRLQSQGH